MAPLLLSYTITIVVLLIDAKHLVPNDETLTRTLSLNGFVLPLTEGATSISSGSASKGTLIHLNLCEVSPSANAL